MAGGDAEMDRYPESELHLDATGRESLGALMGEWQIFFLAVEKGADVVEM